MFNSNVMLRKLLQNNNNNNNNENELDSNIEETETGKQNFRDKATSSIYNQMENTTTIKILSSHSTSTTSTTTVTVNKFSNFENAINNASVKTKSLINFIFLINL
jgi:hypothetical protein